MTWRDFRADRDAELYTDEKGGLAYSAARIAGLAGTVSTGGDPAQKISKAVATHDTECEFYLWFYANTHG